MLVKWITCNVTVVCYAKCDSGSMSASGPAGCGFKSQSVPKVIVTLTDHTVPSDQDFK